MDIFELLKNAGVEIPEDKKDAFNTEFRKTYKSEAEVTKRLGTMEKERDGWKERAETAEETLKGFEGKDFDEITKDRDSWKEKFEELETKQKEAVARAERTAMVEDFLKDMVFVNDITRKSIISQLEEALSLDSAKGKSVEDLFNGLVKDKDGNMIPNIIIEESQLEAERRRAGIVTRPGGKRKPGTKYTTAELMRMKNENPSLDISQYI